MADVRSLFEPLLERNPSGTEWLPALLRAAPHGRERLGELAADPGYIHANMTIPGLEGRRTCFHYPVAPPPELLTWFIEHPERLRWPGEAELSPEARMLRRALIHDEPPGARARAQSRARELLPIRSAFAQEWWRFEHTYEPDCVLITDRLVLVIDTGGEQPVSEWYPQRSKLVQALETAVRLAGERRGAAIHLGDAVAPALEQGAPHLDAAGREALAGAYLGSLSWDRLSAVAAGDE